MATKQKKEESVIEKFNMKCFYYSKACRSETHWDRHVVFTLSIWQSCSTMCKQLSSATAIPVCF